MRRKENVPQRYATTFDELDENGTLSPIVGLDMVSSEQVAAYLGVTHQELLKARAKCKSDLDALGVVSMNGRAVVARVPCAERVDGCTYKAKLYNGQDVTIQAPPRVYYTAAGVARVKEELDSDKTASITSTIKNKDNKPIIALSSENHDGVQIFQNPEFGQIRTVKIDGEPWLVGKDVAISLGYADTDQALRQHVDKEDKLTRQFNGSGQNRSMTIINESGLYSLILSSKLPSAKKFKRWVTSEILPSIRKHGAYMTPDTLGKMIASPEFGIKLLTALRDERDKNKVLSAKIETDKPKVEFANHISDYKGTISVGDFAKLLSKNGLVVGRNKLYAWMRDENILNRDNIPYQKYMNAGYFTVIETMRNGYPYQATRITGAGQLFLQKRFAQSHRCPQNF